MSNPNEGWFRVGGFAVGRFEVQENGTKVGGWLSYWRGDNDGKGCGDPNCRDEEDGCDADHSNGCDYFCGRAFVEPENNLLWLSSWKGHGFTGTSLDSEERAISELPKWTETRWCLKSMDFDFSSLYDCLNDCVASPTDPEAVAWFAQYEQSEKVRRAEEQERMRVWRIARDLEEQQLESVMSPAPLLDLESVEVPVSLF